MAAPRGTPGRGPGERVLAMGQREFHYRWEWQLESDPDSVWRFVADTNRFNRETGLPAIEAVPQEGAPSRSVSRRRLRTSMRGMKFAWEEEPFEWVKPKYFGVVRRFTRGPVAEMRIRAELFPRPAGGTRLVFEVWAKPRTIAGQVAIQLQVGRISARRFEEAVRNFDRLAASGKRQAIPAGAARLVAGGRERLESLQQEMLGQDADPQLLARLVEAIQQADDHALSRMRPYVLADMWGAPRRSVLELCLLATRVGLLDYRWDLNCPHCRGASVSRPSLREIESQASCESCGIDFTVSFDRLVELTFRPSAAIREVEDRVYCVGGPEMTPHIAAQQLLRPSESRSLVIELDPGKYRLRAMPHAGSRIISVERGGPCEARLTAAGEPWNSDEIVIGPLASLRLENLTAEDQQFVLEHTAWNDHIVSAADVTSLQRFRDLFADETLLRGEQFSVGSLTVLFTDLRNSTHLYMEIGDAPAFDCVLNHFEILQEVIAQEAGAIVKTIGDAVMAVFRRPVGAINAVINAQQRLASPPPGVRPLILKAGIHHGHCIAVNLNERLDYFGSTVNLAARLEGLSQGNDVVISSAVHADPEVAALFNDAASQLVSERIETTLKGFDQTRFEVWRIHHSYSTGSRMRPA